MRTLEVIRTRETYRRLVPSTHLSITATAIGSAETFATVPEGYVGFFKGLSATNTTGSAVTLTVCAVPSGGSAATGNKVIDALSIAANTVTDLTSLMGGAYVEGTEFAAYASASGLNIRGSLEAWN